MSDSKEIVEATAPAKGSIVYRLPFVKQIAEWVAKKLGLASVNDLPGWAWAQVKMIRALVKDAIGKPSGETIKTAVIKLLTTMYNPVRQIGMVLGFAGLIIRIPGARHLEKPAKKGAGLIKRAVKLIPTVIGVAKKLVGVLDIAKKVVK